MLCMQLPIQNFNWDLTNLSEGVGKILGELLAAEILPRWDSQQDLAEILAKKQISAAKTSLRLARISPRFSLR